jgi:flagellar biosynthesis/type III secretory pathway protein FliH
MDGSLHRTPPSRLAGVLFEEDFDRPTSMAEPEVIEPTFSAAEMASAREDAWRDGRDAGVAEVAASDAAAARHAVELIAAELTAARDTAATLADQSAEAIARLLLASLAAIFPTLCVNHGEAEVLTLVRVVLPGLAQEPVITVRINPCNAPGVAREVARLDPNLATRVQITEDDAMPPGDVRIDWRNGGAVRDATALWEQVAAVLVPAGLLRPDAAIRETVDGK